MVILDTNVFSEPTKPIANPKVLAWLDRQEQKSLYLTAISLAELLQGIAVLPDGKRKSTLKTELDRQLATVIVTPILAFDEKAAHVYAEVVAYAKRNRYTLPIIDAQIASVAKLHGFGVATRDTKPFAAAGVAVINPWEE